MICRGDQMIKFESNHYKPIFKVNDQMVFVICRGNQMSAVALRLVLLSTGELFDCLNLLLNFALSTG